MRIGRPRLLVAGTVLLLGLAVLPVPHSAARRPAVGPDAGAVARPDDASSSSVVDGVGSPSTVTGVTSPGDLSSSTSVRSSRPKSADAELVPLRTPVRCPGDGNPTTGSFPGPDERDGRRWVVVGEVAGHCDRQSSPFHLANADARLTWRSDAESFVVFLLDPREPDSLSGYAQTVCSGPCAGSMVLLDKDIDDLIRVQASDAAWSVRVEQYVR